MDEKKIKKHLYAVWRNMIDRCYNENNTHFQNYGARGILVCKRWHTFNSFYADMVHSYVRGLQIERKNNNKGYSPSNCCWATRSQQARNKRNNRLVPYKGESKTFAEWAEILGFNADAARTRVDRHKWSIDKAFETPFKKASVPKAITFDGKTLNASQWSKLTGITATTILSRESKGLSPSEILTPPKKRKPRMFKNHVVVWEGQSLLVSEWASLLGIPYSTLISRFKSGKTLSQCFSTKHGNCKGHHLTSP